MNEYFDPATKTWRAIDVMYNGAGFFSANGDPMNVVQVMRTSAGDSATQVKQAVADSFSTIAFNGMPTEFHDLYGIGKDLFIHNSSVTEPTGFFGRAIKYFSASKLFSYYSETKIVDNKNFYIKQFLTFLLFISGFVTILLLFIKRIKKASPSRRSFFTFYSEKK